MPVGPVSLGVWGIVGCIPDGGGTQEAKRGDGRRDKVTADCVASAPYACTGGLRQTDGEISWWYSVDLDSVDNDWAVEHGTESGWDLYLDGYGRLDTHDVVLFDHVPTEAECREATVRQTRLQDEQSVVGAMMCVSTSEDRYAFVRIAALDEEQRTTSVDIVVWE